MSDEKEPPERKLPAPVFRAAFVLTPLAIGLGLLVAMKVLSREPGPATIVYGSATPAACCIKADVGAFVSADTQAPTHSDPVPTHDHPLLGRPAPDFELSDTSGKARSRRELLDGRSAVLVFYQGSGCASCVRQLHEINADLPRFRELDAQVVAISSDAPEATRRRFEQGALGFPLLSDPENRVARAYGLLKETPRDNAADRKIAEIRRTVGPRRLHAIFIVDRGGVVRWVNSGDMPLRRDQALFHELPQLRGLARIEDRSPATATGPLN